MNGVETVWQDLRHGVRMLVHSPGFALTAMISIAIGVGANAAMFSMADTLLLRPLTVPRASAMVTVSAVVPRLGFLSPTSAALSYPDYVDVRDRAHSFAGLMAYRLVVAGFANRADQPAQRKFGMAVSGNLFDVLGIGPARGRSFGVDEDRVIGRDPVVVLDHDTWEQQFASDPAILQRRVRIGGIDMAVIGVMPRDFSGPDQFVRPGYYIPLAMLPILQNGTPADELTRRDLRNLAVKGRLKPAVSMAQARDEARLIAAALEQNYPASNRSRGLTVRSETDARVDARPSLAVLAGMLMTLALVVLVVACANVAGLLASRAPVRAREMALRLAIGAGRLRLVRQLMAEALLIAAGGGAAGLAIGYIIIGTLRQVEIPTDVPLKLAFELNGRVLLFGMGVAAFSVLLSSLVPAWRSTRADLITSLKNPRADRSRRSRLWGRNALVCGQVALSLIVLTAAVFLYRAYQSELLRGPGFRTDHILMMSFDPELAHYDGPRTDAFYRLLADKARSLPGVKSVALTSSPPMDPIDVESTMIAPEGFQFPAGTEAATIRSARIDHSYFDTMGIRILAGRAFRASDTAGAPRAAVVNETLAAHYWPAQDVIGKRFRLADGNPSWVEIVGIAATTKYRTLSEGPTDFVYFPRTQSPAPYSTLLVETQAEPAALAMSLRETVRTIEPNMPVFEVRTMDEFYDANAVRMSHALVQIVGGIGSMAMALAMIGLYGLVAYSVSRRTHEIGIRMAVGATAGTVLWMVLRHALALTAGGSLVGVIGSLATGGLLRAAFPFPSVGTVDLSTYLVVVPALFAVTLLASAVPAWRAARIRPLDALRVE